MDIVLEQRSAPLPVPELAVGVVEDEVRELVRRRGVDPASDPQAVRRLVGEVLADYDERTLSGGLPPLVDLEDTAREVFDAVAGYGPLQVYLDDPTVEEIWINERLTPAWAHLANRGSEVDSTSPTGPLSVNVPMPSPRAIVVRTAECAGTSPFLRPGLAHRRVSGPGL